MIISHRMADGRPPPPDKARTMEIGEGNLFESFSTTEAIKIGNYNIFRSRSSVKRDVVVGSGCMICPRVTVISGTRVQDGTVLFGANMMTQHALSQQRHKRQIKYLRPLLYDYWKKHKEQMDKEKLDKEKSAKEKASGGAGAGAGGGSAADSGKGRIGDLKKARDSATPSAVKAAASKASGS